MWFSGQHKGDRNELRLVCVGWIILKRNTRYRTKLEAPASHEPRDKLAASEDPHYITERRVRP